jgi:hypothetical protein
MNTYVQIYLDLSMNTYDWQVFTIFISPLPFLNILHINTYVIYVFIYKWIHMTSRWLPFSSPLSPLGSSCGAPPWWYIFIYIYLYIYINKYLYIYVYIYIYKYIHVYIYLHLYYHSRIQEEDPDTPPWLFWLWGCFWHDSYRFVDDYHNYYLYI